MFIVISQFDLYVAIAGYGFLDLLGTANLEIHSDSAWPAGFRQGIVSAAPLPMPNQ
jgi:hypothetical protein